MSVISNKMLEFLPTKIAKPYSSESTVPHFLLPRLKKVRRQMKDRSTSSLSVHIRIAVVFELASKIRLARDQQRESCALSELNPAKSVAQLLRCRSSAKRGYEIPPMLIENKTFVLDESDKAELFNAFFAKDLTTESEPVPSFQLYSDNILGNIDFSIDGYELNVPGVIKDLGISYSNKN
ncbi:unnamed protein product [Dibothriocephalus latus]|uniref:Uncharacterized protein n=1 Tax=Dibothriocephalus latus TaxID=60516 RepID=A0A3P7M2A1_DIBLA|nr:unnamed protein product [Dibothriocephalus latus]